jgi:GNAT superfamily N-acetyltransferase
MVSRGEGCLLTHLSLLFCCFQQNFVHQPKRKQNLNFHKQLMKCSQENGCLSFEIENHLSELLEQNWFLKTLILSSTNAPTIRRSSSDDSEGIMELYSSLSEDDLEFRFMNAHHLTREEAGRIADSGTRTTLVAINGESIIGEATLEGDGEISVVVAKKYREEGIGAKLLEGLVFEARVKRMKTVKFYCLPSNQRMIWLGTLLGFKLQSHYDTEDEWVLWI